MNLRKIILNLYFQFLDKISFVLKTENCLCCGTVTNFLPVCKPCQEQIFKIDKTLPRCSNCGKFLISEDRICTECRENPVINNLDKVYPLFSYRLWNKEILFKWKLQSYRNFAYLLSKKILQLYSEEFNDFVIVPVPPRPNKIKKNGWDQIDDLIKFIKVQSNTKVLNLLKRTEIQQQKKLNREQRLSHKGSAFILDKKFVNKELPKKVLIIDDILTTGITLENCALALKNAGVEEVCAITVFIAD